MDIEINKKPDPHELHRLFNQAPWANKRSYEKIVKMLENNDLIVCIRVSQQLVGFGRVITDGCFRGILDDLIIDSSFRNKGIGSVIMNELLNLTKDIDEVYLNADHELESYYSKFGFENFDGLTMILKKKIE